VDDLHGLLRVLALRDPREARERLCALLDSNAPELDELLHRISLPGEGRLRHLVASTVRTRADKGKVVPHLAKWLDAETDEFARRAIAAALEGTDLSAIRPPTRTTIADPKVVEGYRVAHARLAHKLRNALEGPSACILMLRRRTEGISDPALQSEVAALLGELKDSFQRVSRIVGFDLDDEWFRVRPVHLAEWLRKMNGEYAMKYTAIHLVITPPAVAEQVQILASDCLLDTILWNLWMNAQQSVSGDCRITVRMARERTRVIVTLVDNGDGFPPDLADAAFRDPFSTHGGRHGSGLLEVQAAMEELHGSPAVVKLPGGDLRIQLTFPLEVA